MSALNARIALGKLAWQATSANGTPTLRNGQKVRTVRDASGRLSEEWLVNGEWTAMRG